VSDEPGAILREHVREQHLRIEWNQTGLRDRRRYR